MPTSAGWALLVLLLTTTMASAGAKRRRVPPAQSRSQGDAGHGGWWRNNSIPDAQPCHVEVAADDLTPAGFSELYDLRRPVVVRGAAGLWGVDTDPFSRRNLLRIAASAMLLAGRSASIPANHGVGHEKVSLAAFIETMGHPGRPGERAEPAYVFDNSGFFERYRELQAALVWPPVYPAERKGHAFFALGPAGSGAQFHFHGDGWSLQLYGRKQWFLYPPGQTPLPTYPPKISMKHWLEHMLPRLQAKKGKASSAPPLECVLGPGDWLYVPEGWYHGTINLEDSVAVSHQLGGVGSGQALTPAHREWLAVWLLTGAGELAGGLAATERLIAIAPDSAEALFHRALLLARLKRVEESIVAFKAAIKARPGQAEPLSNYGAMLLQRLSAMPPGPAQTKLARQAERALLKAVELNPVNPNPLENLALLYAATGQLAEAERFRRAAAAAAAQLIGSVVRRDGSPPRQGAPHGSSSRKPGAREL